MNDTNPPDDPPTEHAGMVAVVGAANAGKSSLINLLTGEKVSIVSPVVQTTRNMVRAILTEGGRQVVFLDTPGVHTGGKKQLNQQMNKIARASTEGVDVVMLVMDRADKPALEANGWMRRLADGEDVRLLFVLNKSDLTDVSGETYRRMWADIAGEKGSDRVPEWIEVSAESGRNVDELRARLFELMPEGPLLFPEDIVSDFPRKLAIGDIIREKYFHRLHQELPHSLAVWVEHLDEQDGRMNIEAHVYVRQNSQKGMVIGNKGRVLKAVKSEAVADLREIYDTTINLTLVVKVMKDWDKNFWILRKLGYA